MEEGKKYARKCSATGKGFNKGFIVLDGEYYFKKKSDLKAFLLADTVYKTITESFNDDYHYYTEWEEEEDSQYIFLNGELIEIEE